MQMNNLKWSKFLYFVACIIRFISTQYTIFNVPLLLGRDVVYVTAVVLGSQVRAAILAQPRIVVRATAKELSVVS